MRKLLKSLTKENSVRGASVLLIVTLTISNVLGLLRDRFLTKNIATYNLDIYYASFRIPDLIFNFLILGTITSAFIPVFSDFLSKDNEKEAWHVTELLINAALFFTIISAIILYVIMPEAIRLVVPKFDGYRLQESIKYSRLLMLTPIFFSVSYILGGALNSYKRFFAYSLAPLIYNFAIIVGAYLAPRYGVRGVVYCVIAGSALHALVQLPAALRLGFRYHLSLDFKNESIRRIIRLMVPRTISMGVGQIMLLVFTAMASAMASGSITAFNLANNIQTVPIVILGTSFATAIFPTLARKIGAGNFKDFSFYLDRSIRAIAFLLVPSSVIFILLRAQIVRLILGSGKFSWSDTRMTAMALGLFSLSLLAQGVVPLLAKAFYALKNTKTPMYISIVSVVVSVGLAILLDGRYSVAGLALAFSVGNFINAFLLFYYLKKNHGDVWDVNLIPSFAMILLMSFVMGVVVWLTMHMMAGHVDMTRFTGIFVQSLTATAAGVATYLILGYLFKCEELSWAVTRKISVPNK